MTSPQQFLTRIGSLSKSSHLKFTAREGNRHRRWHPTLHAESSSSGSWRRFHTFLPYPEFDRSVECLDDRRLGMQRVEAWQILRIVKASPVPVKGTAWANSPAVRMWRGFPDALVMYYNACLLEWERRGFKNEILQPMKPLLRPVVMPPWLGSSFSSSDPIPGDDLVHASHRSNLLRKKRRHYSQFGWTEPWDLPYVWPVPLVRVDEMKVVIADGNYLHESFRASEHRTLHQHQP